MTLIITLSVSKGIPKDIVPRLLFLQLCYFGFRGEAQFVCLAQPVVLGTLYRTEEHRNIFSHMPGLEVVGVAMNFTIDRVAFHRLPLQQ